MLDQSDNILSAGILLTYFFLFSFLIFINTILNISTQS